MPVVQVSVVEGRKPQTYAELMKKITDVIEETLGAPRASIRVIVQETPPYLWSVGGEPKALPPKS